MKIIKTLFFLALVFSSAFAVKASSGKCGPNIRWELNKTGNLVITGEGEMNDFSAGNAPWRADMVYSVEIGDSIRSIGRNAFAKTKIVSIILPPALESIGDGAFKDCKSLATITIPYGVNYIGKSAFEGCGVLPKVIVPGSVRNIGERAFAKCSSLTEISVPSRVKTLGKEAFKDCNSLATILELPDFVTVSNYGQYGLAYSVVNKYHQSANAKGKSPASDMRPVVSNTSDKKPGKSDVTGLAYGQSDVDAPLTPKPQNNTNSFAFIIANENYNYLSDVAYAHNDGNSFATYCRSILGIPDANINVYKDATLGNIKNAMGYLRDIDDAFDGDIDVIFYYAGHGSPTADTEESLLIPVDAGKVDKSICYPLDDLYAEFSALKANSIKVFLDACFSGPARDNTMVETARKVAIKPKQNKLNGNIVIVSAASNEQTAWQFNEQGHGLFTYYLLKKLRETGGDVTLGELTEYITTNVKQTSVVVNQKSQTPAVAASPLVGQRWRTWTLK